MYFHQKSGCSATLHPPLLLSFTANTDHPRAGEVWPGCAPRSGAAMLRILIGPKLWRVQGVAGSQSGLISRSFLVDRWRRTDLGEFPKLADSIAV